LPESPPPPPPPSKDHSEAPLNTTAAGYPISPSSFRKCSLPPRLF